jgi:hypothetical protein
MMKKNNKIVSFLTKFLIMTILFGCAVHDTPTARETIEAYYDALNENNFEVATDFVFINDPITRKGRIESYKGLDPYYSDLEVIPFADIPESNNNIGLIEDQGDIPGKCERFLVKGYVEYPSGWGAGPTGAYSTFLVLVNLNNKWVIVGEGAPLVDGCTRAIKTLGLEDIPEDENDTPPPD